MDYIGELEAFKVSEILAVNPYDSSREISIRHNKGAMAAEFQGDRLTEYVTVKPAPKDLKIDTYSGSFILTGSSSSAPNTR